MVHIVNLEYNCMHIVNISACKCKNSRFSLVSACTFMHGDTHAVPILFLVSVTLVLLSCFNCIFLHLKLELLMQFPALNDEKYDYL